MKHGDNYVSALRLRKCLWLFCLLLWMAAYHAQADVSLQVSPEEVKTGEAFRLQITSDDPNQSGVPDLTSLQENFQILSTEQTVSYTIINGQSRSFKQWSIVLISKKEGVIPIPAIDVGTSRTNAAQVRVLKQTSDAPSDSRNTASAPEEAVALKTTISPKEPFVGQQVLYTVKLYNSGQLLDAEYHPPTVENALLIPLGDADRYQTAEKGQNYVVEEQRYAIFPQKSGSIRLVGPSFHALVYDAIPRQVNLPAKTADLKVQPIPPNFKGQWLPAKNVALSETYDASHQAVAQGDVVTRTIILEATAIPGQLLPVPALADATGLNVYPEKPVIQNSIRNQELIGKATIKVTYLFNRAGDVTIPEIRLPWYNTDMGREETAKLPPRTFHIAAKPSSSQNAPPHPEVKGEHAMPTAQPSSKEAVDAHSIASPIGWGAAIFFGMAWLLTLIAFWFRPKYLKNHSKRRSIKSLHEACIRNNPHKARNALIRWASLHWPDKETLDLYDVVKRVHDPKFKKQLHLLTEALYGAEKQKPWRGAELWIGFAEYRQKKKAQPNKSYNLPPINP